MRGKIATCGHGLIGIITDEEPYPIRTGRGNQVMGYRGINLFDGRPWQSRNPVVLGTFEEVVEALLCLTSAEMQTFEASTLNNVETFCRLTGCTTEIAELMQQMAPALLEIGGPLFFALLRVLQYNVDNELVALKEYKEDPDALQRRISAIEANQERREAADSKD